jgi:class 3 adenylate cyclase
MALDAAIVEALVQPVIALGGRHGHAVRRRRCHGGVRRAVPATDHADRAVAAAAAMHRLQDEVNSGWAAGGLPEFGLGIGVSTGEAAAALLGSEERLEYTLVGDMVNLSQRLQQLGSAGETVISDATKRALSLPAEMTALPAQLVKGRDTPIIAYKLRATSPLTGRAQDPAMTTGGRRSDF